jgi:hypothetical protein
MTIAHDPVSFPTDPHPVRPGTSAALTARTIDATVHPPIVRAQESVAAAIPRLVDTVSSPLFLTTVALTLVLVWMAVRMRSRMVGLVLSAMLVMTLTSFRPARDSDPAQIAENAPARQREYSGRFERREYAPPTPEPAPFTIRLPRRPEPLRPDVDRIMQDEEELRAAIEELTARIEAELRRRARHQSYDYRSARRWIRKLPKPVREWAYAGQETIVAWARDP